MTVVAVTEGLIALKVVLVLVKPGIVIPALAMVGAEFVVVSDALFSEDAVDKRPELWPELLASLAEALAKTLAPTAVTQYSRYRLLTATGPAAGFMVPAAPPVQAALAQLVKACITISGAETHPHPLSMASPRERPQSPAAEAMTAGWRQAETQGACVTTAC